jgi:hypothetical protein
MDIDSNSSAVVLGEKRNTDIPDKIDALAAEKLGIYVYVLADPTDGNRIFYVGKGQGDRVLHHGREKGIGDSNPVVSKKSKKQTIDDILTKGNKPGWYVVRRNLGSAENAFHVEAGIIYALTYANKQSLTNLTEGMNLGPHKGLSAEEVRALNAKFIDPKTAHPFVMLFNIDKGYRRHGDIFEATRKAWSVNEKFQNHQGAIAIGLIGGISKGVFGIKRWTRTDEVNKKGKVLLSFEREEVNEAALKELELKNWSSIVNFAGFWRHGSYLVVELDGCGSVRYLHGLKDKDKPYSLKELEERASTKIQA